jgi:hypothetical protein
VRLLHVGDDDTRTGSRVGGAPPAGLDLVCPVCDGPAEYVLTLAPDVLGPTVADHALSLLACEDLTCRFAGPHGGCSALVVAHADDGRAGAPPADGFEGRALAVTTAPDAEVTSDDAVVGGTPGFLQSWGYEAGSELEAAGLAFLAQWSEQAYRPDMAHGAYPFLFGTVHLYAATTDGRVDLGTARGFWQNA